MNKKILIVDDEKEIVDLLEVYLSNDGYSVYKCYNGLEAMKCIKQSQIDLAILDIMLPDIDGFRLCQKIREKFYFPIIMLTAKIEDSDKIIELGEDYAKLAGLTAEEDLKEPTGRSMKKRLPWLIVLLGLGMLVSSVVGVFEGVVAALPIVICFQSLVLDMAGNVGTQSLAVTIRVLMDENVTGKQKMMLLGKEMKIGLLNGGLLGILALVLLGVYVHAFKGYAWAGAFAVSGCVGISLVLAMMVSSMVGTVIPMFFHKIKVDPAVASGPLITTVNDLVAVVTYYGLAFLFLVK